ncbi:hypothetical protein XA68_13162 [Ophiocordyceps unilateralis]|uniref:AB hydrolase-1 domain-containing protein n=1 Tax=Ophiocordyceps unilateralis TaxID=268505 RepID=A0A2A9PC93_OPHUN|nr:hypothetical protein XA68_13162 [Ophiocordyceps unilateralis]
MPRPGLLHVTTNPPGPLQGHFTDWYNNEHGPSRLRLPHLISNGLRYQATDSLEPTNLAIYDVRDVESLASDRSYQRLRVNHSEREAELMGKVDVDRRILDLIFTRQAPDFTPAEILSPDIHSELPSVIISVHDTCTSTSAYRQWFTSSHVEAIANIDGWLRTRLFHDGETNDFLALHDFRSHHGFQDAPPTRAECVAASSRRFWKLVYVLGPAPRDLAALTAMPSPHSWTAPSEEGKPVTRTLAGEEAFIVSYVTADDGLVIPYRLEGNSASDAPVVAMSNSLLTSLDMWDPLVKLIRQHRPDLAILRYDFRGRHALPLPPPSPSSSSSSSSSSSAVTIDVLASDLYTLLTALRIPRLHALIGVSLGGVTALRFAQLHPNRLSKLIGCDFNPSSTAANAQAWRHRATIPLPALAEQTVARWLHPRNASIAPWLVPMLAANDPAGFVAASEALHDYDLKPDSPGCNVPSLLVVGDADARGAMHAAMADFAPMLGPEGATLRVVAETGHVPMCEDPDAFWDVIRDAL